MVNHKVKGYIAVVLSVLLWGSSFPAFKIAIENLRPLEVVAYRNLVATLFIGFLILVNRKRVEIPSLKMAEGRSIFKWILVMTLLEPILYYIFEGQAMVYTTAGQAGMVTGVLPVLVIFPAYFILKERPNRFQIAGAIIAFTSIILLTAVSEEEAVAPNPVLGNTLEFMAMVSAAFYMTLSRKISSSGAVSPLFLTFMMALVGTLFFTPALFLLEGKEAFILLTETNQTSWGAVLYLGVASSFGAYQLYNYSLKQLSVQQSSIFINLIAPVALIISQALGIEEPFSVKQWFISGFLVFGVFLAQKRVKIKKD